MERAEAAGANALAVFTAASDEFTQRNIGMTIDESLEAFAPVLMRATELGWWKRAYVSTAFGCPFTGAVAIAKVVEVSLRLLDLGADEICLGDTIGVGVPVQVHDLTAATIDGGHRARSARLPLPRHARHGAGQRRRRARGRHHLLRLVDRRHGRLSVCTGRGRKSRHRGSRLSARRAWASSTACALRACSRRPVSSPTRWASRSPARSARPAAGTRDRSAPAPRI